LPAASGKNLTERAVIFFHQLLILWADSFDVSERQDRTTGTAFQATAPIGLTTAGDLLLAETALHPAVAG
jgi:hypothetical protein